jgi:flagellar biosynthesis/type III secretory pathway M-ring protein FliF/YscJ
LLDFLVVVVVLAVVVLLVSAPLRSRRARDAEEDESAERAALEAAKEAKYREIRDAELDYRTGKLSEADWRALDRSLRAEAVELLKRLDALEEPANFRC